MDLSSILLKLLLMSLFKEGSKNAKKMLFSGMSRPTRLLDDLHFSTVAKLLPCRCGEKFRLFGLVLVELGGKKYQTFTKKPTN